MVPNTPMLKGRESIESHLRRVFDQGTSKMTVTPLESLIAGDLGYAVGTYSLSTKTDTGETTLALGWVFAGSDGWGPYGL